MQETPPPASAPDPEADDAAERRRWRQLVERDLPAAAATRGWHLRFDHCFARVLLDNAAGRPWREVIAPPAWRNAPLDLLRTARRLGESVLRGERALEPLDRRSLALRGKRGPRQTGASTA